MSTQENTYTPDLKYKFHDSILKGIEIGPRHEVTLYISLYSIYYAGAPNIQVRFGAITNFDSVSKFFGKAKNDLDEDENGYVRVAALKYDSHELSNTNDLHFYLSLDCGELRIHCGKLSVTE